MKGLKDEADIIRVRHMYDATLEALQFAKGRSRSSLKSDRMLTLALLKELELIGEAASKITESFRSRHPTVPWSAIVATRNRLIHGYFDIDLDIVWRTIEGELPALAALLTKVLNEVDGN